MFYDYFVNPIPFKYEEEVTLHGPVIPQMKKDPLRHPTCHVFDVIYVQ